jgi:two-component system phosphate regulon sensor histidine kinase PhoR
MSDMLTSVADECASLRADGPVISVDIRSPCHLKGDENQLRSAVSNLVVNAINHTPAGGSVILRWDKQQDQGVLSVIDDGEGIEKIHLPRLTERFYRVDAGRSREQGGTGLGLAIVKHILNRHEARLEIKSEKDSGSEFTCVFPASRLAC